MSQPTAFQKAQLRAFDAAAKQAPAELIFHGRKAIVVAKPIERMETMQAAGYDIDVRSRFIEIKGSDLDRLGFSSKSVVTLDGATMKVGPMMRDETDPIVNVALEPQK